MRTSGPVENNPEGAEGSESAPPTVYVCEYCKREYEIIDHALHCERRHAVYTTPITCDHQKIYTIGISAVSILSNETDLIQWCEGCGAWRDNALETGWIPPRGKL